MSWNLLRLYARSLVMYKPKPGAEGLELTPDLAESLGQVSADGLTWTYKLRPNLKFEDGTNITSKDVKYAVMRAIDTTGALQNGGAYLLRTSYVPDPGRTICARCDRRRPSVTNEDNFGHGRLVAMEYSHDAQSGEL